MSTSTEKRAETSFLLDTRSGIRARRRTGLALIALETALLGMAGIGVYAIAVSSPGSDLYIALIIGVAFSGSLSVPLGVAICRTVGESPNVLHVTVDGFRVGFPTGRSFAVTWVSGSQGARLVDGSLIGERPDARRLLVRGHKPFSLPQDAQVALVEAARAKAAVLREGPIGLLWEGKLREYVFSCEST